MSNIEFVPVVLVVPPFFPCHMPSIACGILKASLEQRNVPCRVFYSNIFFAQMIGFEQYYKISSYYRHDLLYERIFATSAHDDIGQVILYEDEAPDYLELFYRELGIEPKERITQAECSEIEKQWKAFIEKEAAEVALLKPQIIGFSCNLQQINSSIAMARSLKKVLPNTVCVIGGKNCDGEMGEEIASSIKIFDYVFQGEADSAFADFCHTFLDKGILPEEKLIRCTIPYTLDELPIPDYRDYFDQLPVEIKEYFYLTFESSRGCWWGQKRQCRFCAVSGEFIKFRSKSPEKTVGELCFFQKKYPDVRRYLATDAIFPTTYFNDFFSRLSDSDFHSEIAYEIKPTLTFDQLLTMKRAKIFVINPGIESLSTQLLKLMNKGCTASTNIRLLRDCRELDLIPMWNFLVCIPGDRVSDYEEQSRIIPFLQHLHPPALVPIYIQRFSPYFEDSKTYVLTDIRPVKGYEHAFPESVDITRLAYFFEARFPSESRERPGILDPLVQQLIRWHKSWRKDPRPSLTIRRIHSDQWMAEDSRECAVQSVTLLDGDEYSVLRQCRIPKYRNLIKDDNRVYHLLDLGFLIEVDGKLLTLVCDLSIFE